MNANELIDRVKNLREFKVEFTFDTDFLFAGKLPFDLTIGPNNKGVATILALSQDEAEERVIEYFHESFMNQGYEPYDEEFDDCEDDDKLDDDEQ